MPAALVPWPMLLNFLLLVNLRRVSDPRLRAQSLPERN